MAVKVNLVEAHMYATWLIDDGESPPPLFRHHCGLSYVDCI
jgi:hypothetical protein